MCHTIHFFSPGNERCPTGRCIFDDPPRRCLVAEKVVAGSEFEILCKNSVNGCGERLTLVPLERHEEDCSFRMVPCPGGMCAERIKLVDLPRHLKTVHCVVQKPAITAAKRLGLATAGNGYFIRQDFSAKQGSVSLMEHAGAPFALQLQSDAAGSYHLWVRTLASKEHADRYRATIRVSHNGSSHVKSVPVYPIDMTNQAVIEHRDCFQLSRKQVEQCVKETDARLMPAGCLGTLTVYFFVEKR